MLEEEKKRKAATRSKPFATGTSEAKKKQYQQAQLAKSQPVENTNWYKGEKPTQRETLARIYDIGNREPEKRDSLIQMYQAELNDPASPIYNPYTSATTTSLSKTNLNNTLKAQQEWAELSKELAWWAQHPSRNYSDDEIVARVSWKNYPTLAKMDAGRESGSPLALTDAVGYSKDAMYGVLWAARNPNKSTGDYMLDAVQSVLGRGKQYQPDEKTANRLNPMSKEYNPYAVGSTMDELAYKYGVYSFDQEWLDNNRHLIANPDTNADYGKIYKAVQNTAKLNDEAKAFGDALKRYEEAGLTPDIDSLLEQDEYGTLRKMQESLKSGQLLDTTAAIDFDPYVLQQDASAVSQKVNGDRTTDEYDQMLSDNMGGSYLPDASKQNSEELRKLNTDVTLPEYIPVATEQELRAFRTTANAGYSDVVYTTADLIANGTGGLAQANAAQQKAAHAYANKNLFGAWDALNDEVGFTDVLDEDERVFLQKYFPEKYAAGELPTMDDFGLLDMAAVDPESGKTSMDVWQEWETMRGHAESVTADMADRKTAADTARQTVTDVMDDLAEVYGEGTDQYNAAVATYEMAYAYTSGVPKVWRAWDAYQDANAEGPITKEYGDYVLKNQRGANARDILVLNALIENAEIMGLPEQYVANMRQQVEDLKTQNDLLAAHSLSSNKDYASQVAAFDAQFPKADGMNLFGQKFSTHEDAVRQAVADPEYGFYSLTTDANPTEITMLAQAMTDEERNNYKYIYVTEGQERATAYFDALSENLYVRAAEERSERTQEWAAENELNSAIATVGSVFLTPMEAASALATLVEFVQTGKVNPYGMNAVVSQMKSDLRTGAKEGAKAAWGEENKVAYAIYSTIYDALTSAADSMVASKFGSIGGAAMMGASAFNSATMDASMRGASGERALLFGAASALIEAGSEKISIDRILGAFDSGASGVRGLLDEIAKGFFSEGAEEMASTLGSAIADDMIMGAMANRETAIAAYMEAGLTREEAEAQAAKDILTDIAYSGLVGGISGSFSSGLEYGRGSLTGTTEQPVQTPEETTQGTTQEAAPTGTPVQRAEAALSTAMQDGVGEVQQTATVSGVLQSFGLSDMEANAAAKNIVGSTNTRVLRKMLSQADDPSGLIQAIAMGSVSERSRSWAILHNARVDSKNAKDIGDQLIAAYNEDANDQSVMTEYDARVVFSAEADISAGVVVSGERRDRTALDDAVEKSKDAQREMDKAETGLESAHQAVVDAQNKFNENLNDKEAMLALKNAINLQYKARERSEAAKRNAILAKKHLDKANADFKAQTEANMVAAREQAKVEVQQKQAELEAYKQEAAKAAEEKRQSDNVAALDAKEFIDTNHPDATDDEQETIQKAYISTSNEEVAPAETQKVPAEKSDAEENKNAVEFTIRLSKLFKVKFKYVNSDSNFEGKYRDGVITINTKTTQGEAIRKVALHELMHHVEKTGEYQTLVDMVKEYFFKGDMEAYDKEVEDLRQLYESQKNELGIEENIDYAYGERELIAEYAARIFAADEQFIERIVSEKPSLAVRIAETLKSIVDKLRGINDPELDVIRNAEKAFRKALEKSADPRTRSLQQSAEQSEHPNSEQFSIIQFARAAGLKAKTNSDGQPYTIVDAEGNEVTEVTPDMIKTSPMGKLISTAENSGSIDASTAQKQYEMFAELMTMVAEYKDQAMIWEIAGSELFSAIKSNSDAQYSTTVDFGTICSKTREVVNVMSETMLKEGRGLTREEVIAAYRNTHKAGMAVPCPVCYVFSRWMGVPSLLETMRKGQERFANATDDDVNAYLQSVRDKYGVEGKDLSESVGKAKTKVQNKLKSINEALLKGAFKKNESEASLLEQAKVLEAELDEIELFNWVNQVLCKTDSKRKPVLDKDGRVTIDPNYKAVPNEVLLDLRRTGEFASEYGKAWTFRTTRGAGMGKAILPYSGAELGDTISGTKRWSASQNPYFTGDDKAAARKMKFAEIRARAQNLIGGQRFQSTSDYRPEWGLDYLSTFLEMQAIGAKGQLYTKVIEAVDMFATAGIEVNMSIMPKNNGYHYDENGNPVLGEEDFSSVTGIDFKGALEKTRKYDNAQMILVGINDTHIELAMADDRISFIIPWHSSGNSKDTLTTLMGAVGESLTNAEDYTDIQTDKVSESQTPEQKAMWNLRMDIMTGKLKRGVSAEQQKLLDSNPYLAAMYEKFYVDESAKDTYGVKLSKAQAGQIFPHEYWDTSLTVDQADENGRRFVEYCSTMGIEPRFGKFADKPGYWKLLIDRRMYNRDGTYHEPKTIDVTKVDISDVAAEVSQAKVGIREQISEAVQSTIDEINARLPAEQFDMQADIDIDADNSEGQYSIPSDGVLKRQVRSWKNDKNRNTHGSEPISLAGDIDTDVDTVYDSASKLHDGFASRVSSAVEGFGSFLDGGVKSKNSLKNKVLRKTREGREYSALDAKDHVRGAVLLERGLEDVPTVIERLKKQFPSIEGEVFLTEPLNASGYRGIHLSVTFENGLHGEIQMTTPEAWSIKKQTDAIYEKWRNVSLDSATPQQVAEYESDYERSSQLWESYYSGFTPEVIRMASASVMGLESQRSPKVPVALPQTPSENSSGNAENPDGIAYSFLPSYNENFQVLTNTTSDAIIAHKGGENQTEFQNHGGKQRQFTAQTLPNNPNIPQWAVDAIQQNPEAMNYQPDSNREQAQRGWQRLQENGYEAEVERLLGLERYAPDDVAEANIIMAMALREDTSDPATFFRLASDYAVKGTTSGQELQARKLFSKMTPNGIRVWVAGKLENQLSEFIRTHQPKKKEIDQKAASVADQIRKLDSSDAMKRLASGEETTIDSSNNRWGVLINEQQQALIDHYKLNDVARPGIFYNRATIKQRMLEAILATPNPLEVTGLGMNLIQRLEFMQDGQAVVTNADLNYIGSRLGEFIGYGGDEGGRDADVAIARAYEAFGNITPASAMEKFRTQRYVNMLLSIPSFTRNIIGNAAQNALNAVSHGGAVLLDKAIASGTGRRTVEFLDAKDRIDGWKAFVEETKNTFRDYFIDKVNAAPNQDKYSTNRRARTFQNPLHEATKDLEAFLMSVGDRNVWKKAFVNSLAEQQKLADQNLLFNDDGTTLTHDQMVERAERDANYATFTEDNLVQHMVGDLARRSPVAADVLSLFVPFTGVPTNIMKRSLQYSPVGLLTAVGRVGYNHMRGQNFDQRAFVNDLSRAFTGSALMLAGYMLGAAGMITMGSGDEDEGDKVYDAKTARGDQYTPYFYDPTTGTNVSMSTFAPAGSPLVWGASIGEALKGDENLSQIMLNALFSSTDSILNASYLSGLSDLFGGYGSLTENAIQVGAENLVSQSIPALFTQAANALDPYVRDTKDKDFLTGLLKTTVNRIPGLRNVVLPEKVTVTGETVPTRENRVSNFYDPFTRSARNDNAALAEAMRLYEAVGTTDVLPSDAVRGKKNSFSLKIDGVQMSVTLTDAQKAEYRKHYGKLWTEALDILMADPAYSVMTDEEKAGKVKKIMQNALKQAKTDFLLRYGQPAEE